MDTLHLGKMVLRHYSSPGNLCVKDFWEVCWIWKARRGKREISLKTINVLIFTCHLNCSKQLMVHSIWTASAKKYSFKVNFLIGIYLSGSSYYYPNLNLPKSQISAKYSLMFLQAYVQCCWIEFEAKWWVGWRLV